MTKVDYQKILTEIQTDLGQLPPSGEMAQYIPELASVSRDKFGLYLSCIDGTNFYFGDSHEKFSIQSISKVLTLTLTTKLVGNTLLERVGVEPSGNPFNSLVLLEYENGIPRNPLINSGALVIADILVSELKDPKKMFLQFVRKIANNSDIHYNESVARSEKEWGYRNIALINLMKSFGNIKNDTDVVLDFYYHQCALEMTCEELAKTYLLFANEGKLKENGEEVINKSQCKRINAVMQTCGFYDEAGEFTYRVGLPGKSGVGGGIAAIHPQEYSVAVWSPRLNLKGNSYLGMKALEALTTKTGLSIF